jgi:predicted acyltransferase
MATSQAVASASTPNFDSPSSTRLISLDIFRGLAVAGMIIVDNPGSDEKAYWAIRHAEWNGWSPADFIFPSFLFLVGVSMVFSFHARLQRGESRGAILLHAFKRSLILIAIGLIVNGMPFVGIDWHAYRFEGVLQRIAVCYFAAAVLVLWTGRRGQWIALAACLLGYWAMLRFAPVPGYGVPGRDIPFMDPDRNLVAWLDRYFFAGHLYNGTRDPEGILSNIPALGTTLIGVLSGYWLCAQNRQAAVKVRGLLLAGVAGLVAGQVWNYSFPINKNLWTSSFVLFSGGFSLAFLAALYWIIEIKQWRGWWTIPALVLGMNAIGGFVDDSLVYGPGYGFTVKNAVGARVPWHEAAQSVLESTGLSAANASLVYSLAALLFCWFLLWLLWRRRIFLKV